MLDLVTRAYDRLESEFKAAVGRGAQNRSLPFIEYVNNKVLFDHVTVVRARRGIVSREGEGDFIRDVCDSLRETGHERLIPALTFDKSGQTIVILVIQP